MTGHIYRATLTMPDGSVRSVVLNFDATIPDFDPARQLAVAGGG